MFWLDQMARLGAPPLKGNGSLVHGDGLEWGEHQHVDCLKNILAHFHPVVTHPTDLTVALYSAAVWFGFHQMMHEISMEL